MAATDALVFRPSRWKYLGFILCGVVGVGLGVRNARPGVWQDWVGLASMTVTVGILIASPLANGDYLKLTRGGFTIRMLFKSRTYRWSDVESFGVMQQGITEWVVFSYSSTYQRTIWDQIWMTMVASRRWNSGLPDTYGFQAEALADLLNQAKQRFETNSVGVVNGVLVGDLGAL